MDKAKLIEMGGKEWIEKSPIQPEDMDASNRSIIKHRFYFNDRDELLEAAGVDGYGQDFYYDLLGGSWAGEICGYEVDKMNKFYN